MPTTIFSGIMMGKFISEDGRIIITEKEKRMVKVFSTLLIGIFSKDNLIKVKEMEKEY
jgi:hypothetical protein